MLRTLYKLDSRWHRTSVNQETTIATDRLMRTKTKIIASIMISYRHKKFDLRAAPRENEHPELRIKEELLALCRQEEEETSIQLSSNYSLQQPKRRRLTTKEELLALCRQEEEDTSNSSNYSLQQPTRRRPIITICDASIESESTSSSHSLPNSISPEALRDICKYHGNMVRKFPKKERTPKDQDRRNKNTIACRMSRRVKKLENLAVEEQYKEFTSQHLKIVEQSMRANAYFHHLNQLVKLNQTESPPPAPIPHMNFSIDYLINGIKWEQS